MAPWHVDPGPPGDPRGRRVIADKRYRPGDVVLRDQPYAEVLYDDQVTRRCDCCLEAADNLLRCAGCKLAHYKNRDHQVRAWRAGHREECAALKQLAPRVPPPTVRLAARAWLQHYSTVAGAGSKPGGRGSSGSGSSSGGDRYGEVLSLQHHWEQLQDGHKVQYAQMAALAWQLVRLANPQAAEGVTPRDLALLIARFAANNHTICDDELRPVGVGIYPLVSLVNHSCQPNCMQSFVGSTLVLRAVRPIAPGDEVTITYVELGATRWERRASLLAQYYFDLDSPGAGEAGQQQLEGTAAAAAAGQRAAGAAERGKGQEQQQQQQGAVGAACEARAPNERSPQEEPVVQPDRTLQLSDGVQLRLYYGSAAPPWPHDPRDLELTAVQLADAPTPDTPSAAAAGAAAGGMWAELLVPQPSSSSGPLPPGGPAGSWATAAESFPIDFAELGLEADPLAGSASGTQSSSRGRWGGSSAGMEELGATGSAWAHSAAGGSAASVAPQVVVYCWLGSELAVPMSSAGSLAGDGGEVEEGSLLQQQQQQQQQKADAAAAALAGAYARALLQLQAAQQLLGGSTGSSSGSSGDEGAGSEGAGTGVLALGAPAGATPAGSAAAAAQLLEHALAAIGTSSGMSSTSPGSQGQQSTAAAAAAVQQASQGPMHVRRRPPAGSAGLPSTGLQLGPRHVLRMRLLAAAVRAAVAAGDHWEAALKWMRQLLPLYEFAYSEVWPNLGLHWAGIAKLEHFLGGRPQAAQHAAQRAAAILACTHGESSGGGSGFGGQGVMVDVRRVLFEAGQELKLSGR